MTNNYLLTTQHTGDMSQLTSIIQFL